MQLRNFKMVVVFIVCSTVLPTGPDTVRSGTAWRFLQGQTRKFVLLKILPSKTHIKKREWKKQTNKKPPTFYFLLMGIRTIKETREIYFKILDMQWCQCIYFMCLRSNIRGSCTLHRIEWHFLANPPLPRLPSPASQLGVGVFMFHCSWSGFCQNNLIYLNHCCACLWNMSFWQDKLMK